MTSESLHPQLTEILQNDLAVDTAGLTQDSRLIEDLGLDSVAFSVALVAIEARTGMLLSEESVASCRTVRDLTTLLTSDTPTGSK
jgi:acyl carrier protein